MLRNVATLNAGCFGYIWWETNLGPSFYPSGFEKWLCPSFPETSILKKLSCLKQEDMLIWMKLIWGDRWTCLTPGLPGATMQPEILRTQQDKQVITRVRSRAVWAPRVNLGLGREDWRALWGRREENTKNSFDMLMIWASCPNICFSLCPLPYTFCPLRLWVAFSDTPSALPGQRGQAILENLAHSKLISKDCLGACLTGFCNVKASPGGNCSIFPSVLWGFQGN